MNEVFKLGVDGRNLCNGLSGIGRVITRTLAGLHGLPVKVEIQIPQPVHRDFSNLVELPHIVFRQVSDFAGQPIYQSSEYDAFWGPAHRLPLLLPKGLPVALTVHDLVWLRMSSVMRWRTWLGERCLFKPAIKRADLIICVSEATADDLVFSFPETASRVRVIYPGADCWNVEQEKQICTEGFALFVGTFEPRKNIERVLEAYADLSVSCKNKCRLLIAGHEGWGCFDLDQKIRALQLNEYVTVIRNPDDLMLAKLYSRCRFLLLPSLYEGFGLPLAEAMQFSKPSLTSNRSSMPEIAGKSGVLVDPYSVKEIKSGMQLLIERDDLVESLGLEAMNRARGFNWNASAQSFFQEISKLR